MRGIARAVDPLGLQQQVALVDLLDDERAKRAAFVADQGQRLADLARLRAEGDRNRPRAPVRKPHRGDDRLPVRLALEARERREAIVGEQLEVGRVARVEAQLRQAHGVPPPGGPALGTGAGGRAITSCATAWRSTKARTLAADASGVSRSVLSSTSGVSGSS